MLTFAESGHPVFRSTSPLSRGVLRSKGGGKLSIHHCADPGTITTVFRTITSVNQLPGSEKKWYCISEDSPHGVWDNMAERMLLELAESGCPIFRATSLLPRGRLKSKGHGKLSIHCAADLETVETMFRIIVFCKTAQSLRSSRRNV